MDFTDDQYCFACGRDNPAGLKLTFHREDDSYVTTFTADRRYQGYQGVMHGGIVAVLLDEVMARYVWELAGPAATARLEIRYRRPVPIGQPVTYRSRITAVRRGGHAYETTADARLADGILLAEATGLVLTIRPES